MVVLGKVMALRWHGILWNRHGPFHGNVMGRFDGNAAVVFSWHTMK